MVPHLPNGSHRLLTMLHSLCLFVLIEIQLCLLEFKNVLFVSRTSYWLQNKVKILLYYLISNYYIYVCVCVCSSSSNSSSSSSSSSINSYDYIQ